MKQKSNRSIPAPKDLTEGFEKARKTDKPKKEPRTLLLINDAFERFQEICEDEEVKPAHVIDNWIAEFLKTYKK